MKISLSWLREYVAVDLPARELAERLTRAGLETESIEARDGDFVLELETTSNRPDHLGHIGVAREVAWLCDVPLVLPDDDFATVDEVDGKGLADWAAVEVEDGERCPRYVARLAFDVRVGPSPEWLRRRLEAVGQRPINNVVDISNYVLFEWGQPLHAFDYDRLEGGVILVRRATQGETMTAINGQRYSLEREDLVIADARRAVAIAGIMGGADTEVGEGTRRVLLESAWFDPVPVRRTSRRLALASESSYRFERRVDPDGVEAASRRFCHLLAKICGARLLSGSIDQITPGFMERSHLIVGIRPSRATRVLGVEIPADEVRESLAALGFAAQADEGEWLRFAVPSYRGDVSREADLVEEVARVHGFDEIPESKLEVFPVRIEERERLLEGIKTWMVGAGYHEALTLSFAGEKEWTGIEEWWSAARPFEIRNPVRADERFLRRSLLPNLLAAVRTNLHAGVERVRLFEVAKVCHRHNGNIPHEQVHLAWADVTAGVDFRAARGIGEGVLRYLQAPLPSWTPVPREVGFAAGEGAGLEESAQRLGLVGCVDLDGQAVWCGELNLSKFLADARSARKFEEFSRFPGIRRDLNVVLDEGVPWLEVRELIRSLALPELVSVDFADLYRGKQVPAGKKSLTVSLLFQSDSRTLTSEEADASVRTVVESLAERIGGELRS